MTQMTVIRALIYHYRGCNEVIPSNTQRPSSGSITTGIYLSDSDGTHLDALKRNWKLKSRGAVVDLMVQLWTTRKST